MSEQLPSYIAGPHEPIPSLGGGPNRSTADMVLVPSIKDMLAELAAWDEEPAAYLKVWRQDVAVIGCTMHAVYDSDGALGLSAGAPCDSQTRHRWRWLHFLLEDLDRVAGRRAELQRLLIQARWIIDYRPADLREAARLPGRRRQREMVA